MNRYDVFEDARKKLHGHKPQGHHSARRPHTHKASRPYPMTPSPTGVVVPAGAPASVIMPGAPGCAGQCAANIGWMGPAITFLANTRRFAMVLSEDNGILLPSTQPITLGAASPAELARQMAIAVQGQSIKTTAQAVEANPVVDLTLDLSGTTVFGVMLRISNSYLNFKFGVWQISLLNNATVQSTIFVKVTRVPCDVIILSINNANGIAQVVPNQIPKVQILAAGNPSAIPGDLLFAESLNQKDLGDAVVVQ